jgi:dipeptidyl aminopeptidase/acylaminoacyl peptidase
VAGSRRRVRGRQYPRRRRIRPAWHQAALKANRPRAYEDFAAVAEDLVKRGVTPRQAPGAEGGSNGGLLMGNMLTLYPQLFGAIACEVPLLDMKRYTTCRRARRGWRNTAIRIRRTGTSSRRSRPTRT